MSGSVDNLNQIMAALQQLQLENEILRESLRELQSSTSRNPLPTESQPLYVPEPTISLSNKFNDTMVFLHGFINQIRLIIRLQPQLYASNFSRVGLVSTLLSGPAQAWFAPLIETSSPLLEDFNVFIAELEATFGETDRRQTALTKLYSLQ